MIEGSAKPSSGESRAATFSQTDEEVLPMPDYHSAMATAVDEQPNTRTMSTQCCIRPSTDRRNAKTQANIAANKVSKGYYSCNYQLVIGQHKFQMSCQQILCVRQLSDVIDLIYIYIYIYIFFFSMPD